MTQDVHHAKHIQVRDACKRIAEVATAHGKFAAAPGTPDTFEELIDLGYRFFSFGADVVGGSLYCRNLMRQFRRVVDRLGESL